MKTTKYLNVTEGDEVDMFDYNKSIVSDIQTLKEVLMVMIRANSNIPSNSRYIQLMNKLEET